jgi:hypothetical protein
MRILLLLLFGSCSFFPSYRDTKRECFSYYMDKHGLSPKQSISICKEEFKRYRPRKVIR